jgi:glucoamylase
MRDGAVTPDAAPVDLARSGRVDLRPPERELATALLGADGLLVPLTAWGEPQQLLWPHPDRDMNLAGFSLGLVRDDRPDGAHDSDVPDVLLQDLPAVQHVEDDADIVVTQLALAGVPAAVTVRAVIDPEATSGTAAFVLDVAVAETVGSRRLVLDLSLLLGGSERGGATLVDPSGMLVAYRRDRVLAVAVARDGGLFRPVIDPSGPQAATRDVRLVVPSSGSTTFVLALAHDHAGAIDAARTTASRGVVAVLRARRAVDADAASGRTPTLVSGHLDVLDRVGLRVIRALQDPGGGVLAAPECDPDMRRSGGYGFVWARDLAFIVTAAAVAGRRDVVDGALGWLVRAQSPDGLYEQRHWSDGRVAPTWGLQLDETGAVLHAIGDAARILGDDGVIVRCWSTVRAGADALARLLHPDTGLPPASLDAWEERVGVHTYSVAATIAGLEAAARMADGRDADAAVRWRAAARRCRAGLDAHLWSEPHGRFLRSRDVARDDDAGAPVPLHHQPPDRPAHPVRSVDPIDPTVDASLLGLAYPFAVLDHDDPRLIATVDAVARELRSGVGVLRYPGDTYVGGNPWLLTRLWLGLARRPPGATVPVDGLADVASCATAGMLLPEQVDAITGRPVWVVPLAWSHAFYALGCRPDHRLKVAVQGA